MQKVCFVEGSRLYEVNDLLEKGWTIKTVNACSEVSSSAYPKAFAYIVLEKE